MVVGQVTYVLSIRFDQHTERTVSGAHAAVFLPSSVAIFPLYHE